MKPLQSASGYGSLDASPLAKPGYYNEIINRVYERDFLPEITNSQIDERIIRCHQQVQIMKAPEVGPWRSYQKNQELLPNQISAEAVCFDICNAAYNAIKIDQVDIHFACESWDAWEEAFLDATYESLVKMLREWVLAAMIMESDPHNRGVTAGKHGNISLGARGNPVVVNPASAPLFFMQLQQILADHLRWKDNEMFVVMPKEFKSVLAMSNFANSEWVGDAKKTSIAIDGMWNTQLAGFNIFETVNLPYVVEADGRVCYYLVAGHKSAFAYASDIIEGRVVQPTDSFSVEYQMLAVWGGKMIYPESIAVAYVTFAYS